MGIGRFPKKERRTLVNPPEGAATLSLENVCGRLTVNVKEALRNIERLRAAGQ